MEEEKSIMHQMQKEAKEIEGYMKKETVRRCRHERSVSGNKSYGMREGWYINEINGVKSKKKCMRARAVTECK